MKTDFYFIAHDKIEPKVQAIERLRAFGASVTQYPRKAEMPLTATRYRVQWDGSASEYFALARLVQQINKEYHETSLKAYEVTQ